MPVAHWCLLAVVLLPYFLSVAARSAVARSTYVADPRAYSETLTGWRRRVHLALIAGVLVAELAQAPRLHVDSLALLFVGLRVAHAALYLADRPGLRSVAWKLGILCVIALFFDAAVFGHK